MRIALFAALLLAVQEAEKTELRCRFAKGEKLVLSFSQKVRAQVDEIPEEFAEWLGDEPADLKVSGEARVEATEIREDGAAVLEGKVHRLRASGQLLGNELDFDYDRARDGEKPKGEPDEGPGLFGISPDKALHALAVDPIRITIDPVGKISVRSRGPAAAYADRLFDLGGLGGLLPKEAVGVGDGWKTAGALRVPNMPVALKIEGQVAYDKREEFERRPCAMLKLTFKVGTGKAEPREGDLGLKIDGTFEGRGDGTMVFALDAGRPRKAESRLDVKAAFKMADPGGEEIVIKARLALVQGAELRSAE